MIQLQRSKTTVMPTYRRMCKFNVTMHLLIYVVIYFNVTFAFSLLSSILIGINLNNAIPKHGLRKQDSTVNQLTFLYNTFCQALDSGKEVRAVFCDISKAFDRVWHHGLIHKLRAAGVTVEVLAWFKNYLANRKQRVVIPGATSDYVFIQAVVPQGSILGPLLFLPYI